MHIWIMDHYSSEPKYGGISRQYDFAKEFSRRGIQVTVIASAFSHFSHSYISDEKCMFSKIDDNAQYVYLKTTKYDKNGGLARIWNMVSFLKSAWSYYKIIERQVGKPDVVVGCSIHPLTWLVSKYIAKKYNAKFIVEVRDLWPANQIEDEGMSPYHPFAILLGMLEKWAYRKADKIIYSMSKGDKYICDILRIPREKAIWIGQPMDCERFDENAKRYLELDQDIRDFIGDSFVCVFTGYYMDYEGVHEMIQAAKIIRGKGLPIKFVFVGSGAEKEQMELTVKENELNNVLVYGRISKELVPALLQRADVCLAHLAVRDNPNSYRYDASKNKVNEYLYSNSCVIYGTHVKQQIVETSGAGYTIEPFNATAFADKIEKVYYKTPEQRLRYGENGKAYILQHNTVEKLVDKYIALLKGEN